MQATHSFVVVISRSEIITFRDQVIRERQADFKACGKRLRDETVKVSSRRVRNDVNKLTHTGWVRLFIGVIPTKCHIELALHLLSSLLKTIFEFI